MAGGGGSALWTPIRCRLYRLELLEACQSFGLTYAAWHSVIKCEQGRIAGKVSLACCADMGCSCLCFDIFKQSMMDQHRLPQYISQIFAEWDCFVCACGHQLEGHLDLRPHVCISLIIYKSRDISAWSHCTEINAFPITSPASSI